jgi:hypothetical protein
MTADELVNLAEQQGAEVGRYEGAVCWIKLQPLAIEALAAALAKPQPVGSALTERARFDLRALYIARQFTDGEGQERARLQSAIVDAMQEAAAAKPDCECRWRGDQSCPLHRPDRFATLNPPAPTEDAAEQLNKVRNILERMERKGGLGHDVHFWIGEALDAVAAIESKRAGS